jgi:biopolymer transport protein ExbB/TolQ
MLGDPPEVNRTRKTEALEAARRASVRSAAVVHGKMKRGFWTLATIASTAPWVGLLGTILGVNNSFLGFDGSKESLLAAIFEGLSQALVPAAFGVMVALVALWSYRYLVAEVEAFDSEMENASLQLIEQLSRLPVR